MGSKGAPQSFQKNMTTEVLTGLIYIICELYIDDLTIPASFVEQLTERLEIILIRFEEKKCYLKSKKVQIFTRKSGIFRTYTGRGRHLLYR